ncbi:MAG TPA: proline iminopeptidase-family hydrolase [Burkholderiaceae bacterium]|nr:proline iminopeptidase-family hydrolase [Burkholderiaceae bacterium]
MSTPTAHEGLIPFRGYRVWYRIVGDRDEPGRAPLLCLHGGPGVPHDYIEPLQALAATGRRVVFYDQLGCGRSDQPRHDPAMWTVPLFVEEIGAVRAALGLSRVHLLGQSWGGMLALEYALTQPAGLASLVLANTSASMPAWIAELDRLRAQLPADVKSTLQRHESAGTTDSAEYQQAMNVFYRRHACRIDPYPEPVQRAFDQVAKNPQVYRTMWGPSEFHVTGTLKTWDRSDRLGEIRVPTLALCGRHDEATPALLQALQHGIDGCETAIFEHSSHMPHVEEPQRYLQVVGDFLQRVDRRAAG